jgi:hypothetical protein
MRTKNLRSVLVATAFLFIPALCPAADITVHDVSPGSKKIYLEPERSALERGKFKVLTAVTAGYDDNTHLDSKRDSDVYMQEFIRAGWVSDSAQKTVATVEGEIMNLTYAGQSDLDLVRGGVRAGIDHSLSEHLSVYFGYNLDIVDYVNSGNGDYYDNALSAKLTQRFDNKVFHSFLYSPSYRAYNDRYIRSDTGIENREKMRNDVRNTLEYELGKFFAKDLVKFNLQYFNNNSNDPYLHYYDYDSYRVGASLTHLFDDKISGYLSAWNQYRFYRGRTLINDAGSHQHETTFLLTSSLFYTVNRSLAFGLSYTYRQNYSNEPVDRYSGSLTSVSAYYKF